MTTAAHLRRALRLTVTETRVEQHVPLASLRQPLRKVAPVRDGTECLVQQDDRASGARYGDVQSLELSSKNAEQGGVAHSPRAQITGFCAATQPSTREV